MSVRFDEAIERALAFVRDHLAQLGGDAVIVRDLLGRIRVALDGEPADRAALSAELHALLGAYSPGPGQVFLVRSEMLAPEAVFTAPELRRVLQRIANEPEGASTNGPDSVCRGCWMISPTSGSWKCAPMIATTSPTSTASASASNVAAASAPCDDQNLP